MLLNKKIKKALKTANLTRFIANPQLALKITSEELVEVNRILKPLPRASFLTLKYHSADEIDWTIRNNDLGFQLWREDSVDKWFLQVNNAQLKAAIWKNKYQETYKLLSSKEQILITFEDDYLDGYLQLLNTTLVSVI